MRRLGSILLLAVFFLPLLSPLLALGQDADVGLPLCCRRNGAHHCAMSMRERTERADHHPEFQSPLQSCPYCPVTVAPVHPDPLSSPGTSQAIFAGIVSHPANTPQTESKWRIARDRSRQKRGPPASALG